MRTGLEHLVEKLANPTIAARPRALQATPPAPGPAPTPLAVRGAPIAGGEKTWLPPDLAFHMATGRTQRPTPAVSGTLGGPRPQAPAAQPKVMVDPSASIPSPSLGAQAAQATHQAPPAAAPRAAAPRGGGGGLMRYALPAAGLAAGGLALSQLGGSREDDRYKNLVYAPTGGGAYG